MQAQYCNYPVQPMRVYYTGSDTLREGYPLCMDMANLGTSPISATQPDFGNLDRFLGVVAPGWGDKTGPCYVEVLAPLAISFACQVWSDQNIVEGDFLGLVPQSWAFGLGGIFSRPVAIANETIDLSATAARVKCSMMSPQQSSIYEENIQVMSHYGFARYGISDLSDVGVTAIRSGWVQTIVTDGIAEIVIGDILRLDAEAHAADGDGVQVQLSANPVGAFGHYQFDGWDPLYFSFEYLIEEGYEDLDFFGGLSLEDVPIVDPASAFSPSDYIGFWINSNASDGHLDHVAENGGVQNVIADVYAPGAGDEEDEWHKCAMHIYGPDAANLLCDIYIDDVYIDTQVAANIPDAVQLSPAFVCQQDGTAEDPVVYIRNYMTRQFINQRDYP